MKIRLTAGEYWEKENNLKAKKKKSKRERESI
jgi:hypothetical protein